jgi:beta-catenin-like protein 1
VEELDSKGVKRMLLAVQKKFKRNQQLRVKYADLPHKFMESELDLDSEVRRLAEIAASPEVYGAFAEHGGPELVVQLVGHENADMVADVLSSLAEITDPDTLVETEDAENIVPALLKAGLLPQVWIPPASASNFVRGAVLSELGTLNTRFRTRATP